MSGKSIEEIVRKMEIDASNVLKFMASNGLVANPSKTVLIFMNLKKNHAPISVKIGKVTIQEEKSAKLLGMTLEGSGEWESHLNGVGGLIPMLNKRLFLIKRLRNHMNYSNVW